MIIVYGADWCEDTQRSMRHLRRLGVPYRYINIDEDLDALERAKALNSGRRRTPVIDIDGATLVEPTNDTLTTALVERRHLTVEQTQERVVVQNVGDLGEEAGRKNLKVAVGLMVRHCRARQELLSRIRDGQIGDIVAMRGYRMGSGGGTAPVKPEGIIELMHQIRLFHAGRDAPVMVPQVGEQIEDLCVGGVLACQLLCDSKRALQV